jgi:hypothetical protein
MMGVSSRNRRGDRRTNCDPETANFLSRSALAVIFRRHAFLYAPRAANLCGAWNMFDYWSVNSPRCGLGWGRLRDRNSLLPFIPCKSSLRPIKAAAKCADLNQRTGADAVGDRYRTAPHADRSKRRNLRRGAIAGPCRSHVIERTDWARGLSTVGDCRPTRASETVPLAETGRQLDSTTTPGVKNPEWSFLEASGDCSGPASRSIVSFLLIMPRWRCFCAI